MCGCLLAALVDGAPYMLILQHFSAAELQRFGMLGDQAAHKTAASLLAMPHGAARCAGVMTVARYSDGAGAFSTLLGRPTVVHRISRR